MSLLAATATFLYRESITLEEDEPSYYDAVLLGATKGICKSASSRSSDASDEFELLQIELNSISMHLVCRSAVWLASGLLCMI